MNAAIDSKFARQAWLRALALTAAVEREPGLTLPVLVASWAQARGASPALLGREGELSYAELARRSHRHARWGLAQGLCAGDVVCLLMANCPDYLAIWLGLTRLGVVVALVNTHLAHEALAHCIRIAAPTCLIADPEHAAAVADIRSRLPGNLPCWVLGGAAGDARPLEPVLDGLCGDELSAADCALPPVDAPALYIYTSGTTGLPKAAKVSHRRLMQWSHWFAGLLDVQPADRMYDCLPLYHSVGGVVAVGATLVGGGSVVIRRRFSASEFWADVRDTRCTLFQYIGELCRYLVNAPVRPEERQHGLRIACGNGLRPEVWEKFRTRFGIGRILEYYASTEGNFSLYNCEGEPGAIGRIPAFLAARVPVALLRIDPDTGEPRRDAHGFCEQAGVDEPGEAVGLVAAAARAGGRFEGYADAEATERKLLRDVLESGDLWYRTGDLMRRDARGFYYFVDRLGETFRWKGENVSTAEVASALAAVPGVLESVVYGVAVPGADGRAGMAALVVGEGFELGVFRARVHERLPAYARPLFLRLLPALQATGTFKPKKQELAGAGFDPRLIADPLYVDDPRQGAFVVLDAPWHADLLAGRRRL